MNSLSGKCLGSARQGGNGHEAFTSAIGLLASHPIVQECEGGVHMERDGFRLILDECPISIIAFDSCGVIFFVNNWHLKHFAQTFRTLDDVLGVSVWELPSVASAGVGDRLRAVLDGQPVRLEEVRVASQSSGQAVWHQMHAVPLFKDGRVVGGLLMRTDISEQKLQEASRNKAREQAEEFARARNEFLAFLALDAADVAS